MNEFSVLIGGKGGFGIDKAGSIISYMINRLGWRVYVYRDYPSIIRGGHTFSIIRASENRIASHNDNVDYLLALNQDTVNFHKNRLGENSIIIYDADAVKCEGVCPVKNAVGIPISGILKEEKVPEVMRNTCIVGAFAKIAGIEWDTLEQILKKEITKEIEGNLKIARRGFDHVNTMAKTSSLNRSPLPILTGNEAIGLGLIRGGLKTYIAYPMTPASPILHFLAGLAPSFSLNVIHPESEIAVMLMALGFSYCGVEAAVGTSGGGFCLMTEAVSLSGMAELSATIVLGQRPGPSTGLPTYSAQTELHFAMNAGQGEFTRFVVAPGDAEEAYFWSALSMGISKKFQIPSIILVDKTLCEGAYNFDIESMGKIDIDSDKAARPLPGDKAVVKVNSYEHDKQGLTTEDPVVTARMCERRLSKTKFLNKELQKFDTVKTYGDENSSTALLCWGSNKGVCSEIAEELSLKVVQPLVLSPFPEDAFKKAIGKAKKVISVENNATGQLKKLVSGYGINVDNEVLKYDGRPFTVDELENRLKNIL